MIVQYKIEINSLDAIKKRVSKGRQAPCKFHTEQYVMRHFQITANVRDHL
ncbi:MAG: hypothetical protein ACJA1A_002643 [Saprospiraceae bacterium]|jgi:hypothetical protein